MTTEALSVRLRRERIARDLTQERLADRSGVPLSRIRRIEQGSLSPCAKDAYAICRVLKRSVFWLFNGEAEMV